jgi:hypothetical protein
MTGGGRVAFECVSMDAAIISDPYILEPPAQMKPTYLSGTY